ncbi:MAG: baseplate J/gp47 family protein [Acetobacteraceae bacterium]|nr:baseplate J/gp47 family protein [Acetobacteraceae bacterium]
MNGNSTPAPASSSVVTTYGLTSQGFIVKPLQAILSDAFTRAQQLFGSDIDLRSSSTIRKVIELGCLEAALLWMALDDVYHSGFTSTASGSALDLLGADLGLSRASLSATGQATFKLTSSAPPVSVLILPPGTLIDSAPPNSVSFSLTAALTLSNDPTQPYPAQANAAVTAVVPGLTGNIGAGQLARINPTFAGRYLTFDPSYIAVSNTAAFTGGDGYEDDSTYRRKLQAQPRTFWTPDAIQTVVDGLDGVRDTLVNDPYGGVDTSAPPFGSGFCFGDTLFQLPRDLCSPYFFTIIVASNPGVLWESEGLQTLSITGTPTEGTFTLAVDGQTTAALPFNATATQVQTALAALSTVGVGNVACSGGPLPGVDVIITITYTPGAGSQPGIEVSASSLTGVTAPAPIAVLTAATDNQVVGLRDQILAALEPIRPISTFPDLIQADTVEVALRAQLTLQSGADPGSVLAAARLALTTYMGGLRLGDAVLYSQVLRILTELSGVTDVQNLHLRRCPSQFGEVVFGPPVVFANSDNISQIEMPCGGNLVLTSTEVAVFAADSNLNDLSVVSQ